MGNVISFLRDHFNMVKTLNASMKPRYAMRVVEKIYYAIMQAVIKYRMQDSFIQDCDDMFVHKMAIACL